MSLTFDQLKDRYFLRPQDVPTGSRIPNDNDGNTAEPLIDAEKYFDALYHAIDGLKGNPSGGGSQTLRDFIYLADWGLQANLCFPEPSFPEPCDETTSDTHTLLVNLLGEKAAVGVDVRVLLWFGVWTIPTAYSRLANWLTRSSLMLWEQAEKIPFAETVASNYASALALRRNGAQALLDYGAHPAAAHHMKIACVYNATTDELTSFCGGMDLFDNFWGRYRHFSFEDAPLEPPAALVTLAAPQLTDSGPGDLPAGDYEVVCMMVSRSGGAPPNVKTPTFAFSAPANITLSNPNGGSITVTGLPVAGSDTLVRGVWARYKNQQDLLRFVLRIKDQTASSAMITTNPAGWLIQFPSLHTQLFYGASWHKRYRAIAWHDLAVQVQGPAAARVAEFLRLRWNDVLNYPRLSLLRPIVYRKGLKQQLTTIPIQKVAVNSTEPQADLKTAPQLTDGGPGVLPAGDYEVFYTIRLRHSMDEQEIESDVNSEVSQITLPMNRKILISNIGYVSDSDDQTVRRQIWARLKSQQSVFYLAVDIKDSLQSAEINSLPSTWAPEYLLPKPIAPLSQTLKTFPPPAVGQQSIQVLLTTAHISSLVKKLFPYTQPFTFAPEGEFTVYYGYKKAIASASRYIYVESQGLWARELMKLIYYRMSSNPGLKVILVTSGEVDPADRNFADDAHLEVNDAVYDALISQLPATQRSDVRYFISRGITVHSKLVIIDDEWAAVGSANWTDRSMATDTEMQLSILDSSGMFAKALRKRLWAEHLNLPLPDPVFDPVLDDIDQSLHLWHPSWGADPGVTLPTIRRVQEIPMPLPQNYPINPFKLLQYLVTDWQTKSF